MLRFSISSSDTSIRQQNQANVAAFTQDILATNILHNQLTDYMWDSYIAKTWQDGRSKRAQIQAQKGGVVYSQDVMDREIVGSEKHIKAWETLGLTADQKLYRLKFSYSMLSQLTLHTHLKKKDLDQDAINRLRRETRRNKKGGRTQEDDDKDDDKDEICKEE